jgi:hypothetical protein
MIKVWKEDVNINLFGDVDKDGALKIAERYRNELQKVYPAADIIINVIEGRLDFSSDSVPYLDSAVINAWEIAVSEVV